MGAIKIAAMILIAVGVMGLVYGGFNYTKDSHAANVGPMELVVNDSGRVNIPVWAGVSAIAIGSVFLFFGGSKKE